MVRHRPKKVPVSVFGDLFMDLWMVGVLSLLCCSTSNEWSFVYAQAFPKGGGRGRAMSGKHCSALNPQRLTGRTTVGPGCQHRLRGPGRP